MGTFYNAVGIFWSYIFVNILIIGCKSTSACDFGPTLIDMTVNENCIRRVIMNNFTATAKLCNDICCSTDDCNLAVFKKNVGTTQKEKPISNCQILKIGNSCSWKNATGHYATKIKHRITETQHNVMNSIINKNKISTKRTTQYTFFTPTSRAYKTPSPVMKGKYETPPRPPTHSTTKKPTSTRSSMNTFPPDRKHKLGNTVGLSPIPEGVRAISKEVPSQEKLSTTSIGIPTAKISPTFSTLKATTIIKLTSTMKEKTTRKSKLDKTPPAPTSNTQPPSTVTSPGIDLPTPTPNTTIQPSHKPATPKSNKPATTISKNGTPTQKSTLSTYKTPPALTPNTKFPSTVTLSSILIFTTTQPSHQSETPSNSKPATKNGTPTHKSTLSTYKTPPAPASYTKAQSDRMLTPPLPSNHSRSANGTKASPASTNTPSVHKLRITVSSNQGMAPNGTKDLVTPTPASTQPSPLQPTTKNISSNLTMEVQSTMSHSEGTHTPTPILSTENPTNTTQTISYVISTNTTASNQSDFNNKSDNDTMKYNEVSVDEAGVNISVSASLITILSFGIFLTLVLAVIIAKKLYGGWQRRHYSKIDYLINGMYS